MSRSIEDPNIHTKISVNLRCDSSIEDPNLLDIRSGDDHFRLDQMTSSACQGIEDPNIHDGFHEGSGTGRCNGQPASVTWRLIAGSTVRGGGPKFGDAASATVSGGCAISVNGPLITGSFKFIEDPNI